MALKRWVIIVQPDVIAWDASSYVASVWPIENTIPLDVISGMEAVIAAISGAAVIILILGGMTASSPDKGLGLMLEDPYMSSRSLKPSKAARSTEILWMPFLVGFRKGPSQWAPRDSAPSEATR